MTSVFLIVMMIDSFRCVRDVCVCVVGYNCPSHNFCCLQRIPGFLGLIYTHTNVHARAHTHTHTFTLSLSQKSRRPSRLVVLTFDPSRVHAGYTVIFVVCVCVGILSISNRITYKLGVDSNRDIWTADKM